MIKSVQKIMIIGMCIILSSDSLFGTNKNRFGKAIEFFNDGAKIAEPIGNIANNVRNIADAGGSIYRLLKPEVQNSSTTYNVRIENCNNRTIYYQGKKIENNSDSDGENDDGKSHHYRPNPYHSEELQQLQNHRDDHLDNQNTMMNQQQQQHSQQQKFKYQNHPESLINEQQKNIERNKKNENDRKNEENMQLKICYNQQIKSSLLTEQEKNEWKKKPYSPENLYKINNLLENHRNQKKEEEPKQFQMIQTQQRHKPLSPVIKKEQEDDYIQKINTLMRNLNPENNSSDAQIIKELESRIKYSPDNDSYVNLICNIRNIPIKFYNPGFN